MFSDRRFLYLSLILLIPVYLPGDLPDFTLLGVDFMKRGREKHVQTLNFKGKSSKLNPKGFHLVPDDPQVGCNQQGIDYDDEGKQNSEAVQQLVSFVLLCKCPNRLDKSSVFFSDVGG